MILMAVGFIVNVLLYVFVVRPLNQSVATVEQRTVSAEQAKTAAQAEFNQANGTLTGKDRARKELDTFYSMVLAQDLSGARRLTYGRVQRLAQENHLRTREAATSRSRSAAAR